MALMLYSQIESLLNMENPITLEEQRKVWTIRESVKGITYYYNRSTKKSQYEMPQCFKITEEDLDHPDWKQYRTAEGRKFYYNALTRKSCWHLPAEVKEWKMKVQEQKRIERQKNGEKNAAQQKLTEAEQIKNKFMKLLKNKMVNQNTKWDSCLKICEDEPIWNTLKISERKKYFNDYITELRRVNELEKKVKTEMNKVKFIKMLKQHKNLTSDCKMHKVQFDFITDPRWRLLEGIERQNAFQQHLDDLAVKQREEARLAKDRNIEGLKILLEKLEVSHETKWDEFRSKFRTYDNYKNLNHLDRINTFTNYIMEAEKKFEEEDAKSRRLKERINRVSFRDLIKEKLLVGEINYKTKWRSFTKQYRNQQRLLSMMDPYQQGSSAQQIFENFMFGIRENHKAFKSSIKHHFKKNNFKMTEETSAEEFNMKLEDLQIFKEAKPLYKQYFFQYFRQKIHSKNLVKIQKERERQKQRIAAAKKSQIKERKAIFKIFKQILEHAKNKYSISDHIEQIQKSLGDQGFNITRQGIFKFYLSYLEIQGTEAHRNHKSSASKSSSSDRSLDKSNKKNKKKKKQHLGYSMNKESISVQKKEKEFVAKSLQVPTSLQHDAKAHDNDNQQEGQIKDDEQEEEAKGEIKNISQKLPALSTPKNQIRPSSKQKQTRISKQRGKDQERMSSHSSDRKKNKKKKQKIRSSSSGSN